MNSKFKDQAESAKLQYKTGAITRDEAKELIEPYINEFNAKSKEIAKKYGMKAKLISFATYIR